VIIAFASLVQSAPTFNKGRINCYITHLKGLNLLNSTYPEFDKHLDSCDETIEGLNRLQLTISRELDFESFKPCIKNDSSSNYWVNNMMLSAVYKASEFLTQDETKLKTIALEAQSHRSAQLAFTSCINENYFGEMFDHTFNDVHGEFYLEDRFKDYCYRKYVVDVGLVATNFTVNPNNLDVSNIDCEPYKKNAFGAWDSMMMNCMYAKNFLFTGDEKQVLCVMEKYNTKELQDKFYRISSLYLVKFTNKTKALERKNFINVLSEIVFLANECLDLEELINKMQF
jgi:hypothetical protein